MAPPMQDQRLYRVGGALEAALAEDAPLTTPQPVVSREHRVGS
jgi:hypothetical protein